MSTTVVPWGPAADGHDQPYWDGLLAGELRLQRCRQCHTWIWGPQSVCSSCYGFDIGWESVQPEGTVYSWSRSWYPYIEELADTLPYISILVELPHAGGRRLLGILTDDPEDTPRIGEQVVGSFERRDGEQWPLLRWRRVAAVAEARR
ncbi:Zn-ribbon domain-containing OB-fold protein [Gordonia sp. NPDC003376]